MSKRLILAVMLSMISAYGAGADAPLQAKTPPKIRVDHKHHGFMDATGKPFVPFGVTYYRPGTGWGPSVEAVRCRGHAS